MAISRRWAAFLAPPPSDWIPREGECVYVRHGYVSTAKVKYFQKPDFVRLLYRYRGIRTKNYYQGFEKTMQIEDIRPVMLAFNEKKTLTALLSLLCNKNDNAFHLIQDAVDDWNALLILADLADDNELSTLANYIRFADKFYGWQCFLAAYHSSDVTPA